MTVNIFVKSHDVHALAAILTVLCVFVAATRETRIDRTVVVLVAHALAKEIPWLTSAPKAIRDETELQRLPPKGKLKLVFAFSARRTIGKHVQAL